MIAILNYDSGNQTSVSRALSSLGLENRITDDPAVILGAHGIIFPGVGAAVSSMAAYSAAKKASKHPEEFGNGAERQRRLGSNYAAVQARVNQMLG